jgi:lipopolysaccharide export system protein LptC
MDRVSSGFDGPPSSDPIPDRPRRAPMVAPAHDRRTRSYDALRRSAHQGRWVRVARFALPALAVLLLALAVAWPILFSRPKPNAPKVTLHELERAPGDDVRMVNARYAGTDARGRPFLITADSALQDPENENLVHLNRMQADLTFNGNVWLSALAPAGLYDTDKQTLDLTGGADIYSNKGYEMHSPQVHLDLKNDFASGDHGIGGHGPLGRMSADHYRFENDKQHLALVGRVHVTYLPGFYR